MAVKSCTQDSSGNPANREAIRRERLDFWLLLKSSSFPRGKADGFYSYEKGQGWESEGHESLMMSPCMGSSFPLCAWGTIRGETELELRWAGVGEREGANEAKVWERIFR